MSITVSFFSVVFTVCKQSNLWIKARVNLFAGSLAGFKAENIELEYAAVFYLTVTTASGSFTVYSDFVFANNRSVDATITAATGSQLTATQAEALRDMIAANTKAEQ